MQDSNIKLSDEELALVNNAEWLLMKNKIIDKVFELFGTIQQSLIDNETMLTFNFPEDCLSKGAKISRGENYRGLPYLILDYPRLFNKDYIFAIRTMFWWGHFFSLTLHLSGSLKTRYEDKILNNYQQLAEDDYLLATGEDEWNHDLGNEDFTLIKSLPEEQFKKIINNHSFIKVSKEFPIELWEKVAPEILITIEELLRSL